MTMQIELFHSEDSRPLPLLVAEKWRFDLAYVDQNGDLDNYLYSVQDWIVGLTGCSKQHASATWVQSNYSHELNSSKLPYKASNGRTYQMDFTDAKGVYRIAQELRPMKKRPELAKVLGDIYKYLADAGVFADQARRKPQQTAERLMLRAKGIEARNVMTATAQETHESHRPFYGKLTDTEYQVLFGATKQTIVERLGFTKTQAVHFRDQLGDLALKALEMAETASATKMRQQGRTLTHDEQLDIVRTCARMVAPGFHQLADYLGVDRIQNKPLLGE